MATEPYMLAQTRDPFLIWHLSAGPHGYAKSQLRGFNKPRGTALDLVYRAKKCVLRYIGLARLLLIFKMSDGPAPWQRLEKGHKTMIGNTQGGQTQICCVVASFVVVCAVCLLHDIVVSIRSPMSLAKNIISIYMCVHVLR